jgi:hypothetical protein
MARIVLDPGHDRTSDIARATGTDQEDTVSNTDDQGGQQRPRPGYYGAGYPGQQPSGAPQQPYGAPQQPYGAPQQPGQPPQPYGAQNPYAPQQPYGAQQNPYAATGRRSAQPGPTYAPRPPRRPQDPSGAFAPGSATAQNALTAGIAVVGVVAVLFLGALARFVGVLSYHGALQPFPRDPAAPVPLLEFFDEWLFAPFAFFVGAFVVLLFMAPIMRRSALPVVILRAVLAGAGGTVLLFIVGIFTGFTKFVRSSDWTWLWTDMVTNPLSIGFEATGILVAGAVVAWLWLGRPARSRTSTPGMPGTVPPADAVPPATVPVADPGGSQQSASQPAWGAAHPQAPVSRPAQQPAPQQGTGAPQAPQAPSAPQWGPPQDGGPRH